MSTEPERDESGRLTPQAELDIYRACIRYRNQRTGRRHFCHEGWAKPAFMRSIVAIRQTLRLTHD